MASLSLPTSFSPATGSLLAEWALDRRPIYNAVLAVAAQVSTGLIPPLVSLVVDYLKERDHIFGEVEWKAHFGKVSPAPALPFDIESLWQGPCPVFPGKKLKETHMLVYIPTSFGEHEQVLSIKTLGELAKKYFPNNVDGYCDGYRPSTRSLLDRLENLFIKKPFWALMTRDILPESRGKSYFEQQAMVSDLARKTSVAYEVPKVLEIAVCILAQFVNFNTSLFNGNTTPSTFIRCQESLRNQPVIVGGFITVAGLSVALYENTGNNHIGIASLRKFF